MAAGKRQGKSKKRKGRANATTEQAAVIASLSQKFAGLFPYCLTSARILPADMYAHTLRSHAPSDPATTSRLPPRISPAEIKNVTPTWRSTGCTCNQIQPEGKHHHLQVEMKEGYGLVVRRPGPSPKAKKADKKMSKKK
mmetsp:Transcript_23823/g.39383  ORF Transcript_23823/g.39383 Transcript_23823/m.39383 type:complete len:139 (-) Transcript_23823:161-577(-)